jgi:hypothetical protein
MPYFLSIDCAEQGRPEYCKLQKSASLTGILQDSRVLAWQSAKMEFIFFFMKCTSYLQAMRCKTSSAWHSSCTPTQMPAGSRENSQS